MPTGIYKRIKRWKLSAEIKQKMSLIHKGKKHSEETKKKLSLLNKGRKFSEEWKRKISEARLAKKEKLGYINSPETRKKMSEAKKGKPSPKKGKPGKKISEEIKKKMGCKKEKHWHWKGGITPENIKIRLSIEYRLWREVVFARDNWTCQKTGIKGGNLTAHHIQNFAQFPELRFAIDNGITLSEKAHKEFHKKYGKINNTKEQLNEFFTKN